MSALTELEEKVELDHDLNVLILATCSVLGLDTDGIRLVASLVKGGYLNGQRDCAIEFKQMIGDIHED